MKRHEEEFDKIAEDMLEKAEKVKCSTKEFYEGLRSIRAAIDNRLLVEREDL